ncbi:MAG: radical SAM protein [Nitrosopumilus sp.]
MLQNPILIHYDSIKKLQKGEMVNPYFVDLQPSNKCNQNCKGCPYRNILHHDGIMLSEGKLTKIVNDLMDFGVKAFDFCGGGEPMTLSYLPNVWNLIKNRKGYYALITNGTIMNGNIIKQLAEQATYVRFSFEASTEKVYCEYKRVGVLHWYKLLQNVERLIKIRDVIKSDCEIGIKFAIGESLKGADHYRNALSLFKSLHPNNIQFKALRHKPEELSLRDREREQALLWIVFQDEDPNFVHSWIIPWTDEDIPQCWLNPLHTVVDENGNVYICCYFYYRREEHCLGNMLDRPIKEIWYDSQHEEKIKEISKRACAKVDCKFFRHHKLVEQNSKNGKSEFL